MILDFVPAVRFTSEMFAAGDRFGSRFTHFFGRYRYPEGQFYTMPAPYFFAAAGLDVSSVDDATKELNNIDKDGDLSGRFRLDLGDNGQLSAASVSVRVWDWSEKPEKDVLQGDRDGLAGVLHALNKWFELSAFFASLPSEVSPEEWDRITRENEKYLSKFIRDNMERYKGDNLCFRSLVAGCLVDELAAFGCTSKKCVSLYKDMRDGLIIGDLWTRFYTPDGIEFCSFQRCGKKTYCLTLSNDYNGPTHDKLWDNNAFDDFFKVPEPSGFSAGKLTAKKAGEWFDYLKKLREAQRDFIGSRRSGQLAACERVERAGFKFNKEGDDKGSKQYICTRGAITCLATVYSNGSIYREYIVVNRLADDIFNIG